MLLFYIVNFVMPSICMCPYLSRWYFSIDNWQAFLLLGILRTFTMQLQKRWWISLLWTFKIIENYKPTVLWLWPCQQATRRDSWNCSKNHWFFSNWMIFEMSILKVRNLQSAYFLFQANQKSAKCRFYKPRWIIINFF